MLPATYVMDGQVLVDPADPRDDPSDSGAQSVRVRRLIEATVQSVNTRPSRRRKRV